MGKKMIDQAVSYISQNSDGAMAISSIIMAIASIVTFFLALIVFISSIRQGRKNKALMEELKIALVMVATITGGAEAGKRIYEEYKEKLKSG